MTHCVDCKITLTRDELHYYDDRCEKCERILWGRFVDDGETAQLKAKLDEALGIIHDLLGLEFGSSDRAMRFLDENLPTAEDVRGILAPVSSQKDPQ